MLPNHDNFVKWLDWFKKKRLYKIWLFLPIVCFVVIGILIKYSLDLKGQLDKMKNEMTPIIALYPKLELSVAIAKLIADYDTIKTKIIAYENKLKPRNISPTDLTQLIAMLGKGAGRKVRVGTVPDNKEAYNLAKTLLYAFRKAQWETKNFTVFSSQTEDGILVTSRAPKTEEVIWIQDALSKIGLESRWMRHSDDIVFVSVCTKPAN